MDLAQHRDRMFLAALASTTAGALFGAGTSRWLAHQHARRASSTLAAASVASAGVATLLVWGRYVEARWLKYQQLRLGWPGPAMRVGLLTDIPASWALGSVLRRAVALLRDQRPDLVLLGGSLMANLESTPRALRTLSPLARLSAPQGVFAVMDDLSEAPSNVTIPRAGAIVARLGLLGVEVVDSNRCDLAPGVALKSLIEVSRAHARKGTLLSSRPALTIVELEPYGPA